MKKVILFILFSIIVISFIGCASLGEVPEEERTFQKIYDLEMSKNEIYDKSLYWMAETFVDSKAVIEVRDKENGKIIGKGIMKYFILGVKKLVRYTMIIDIKEDKLRLTFKDYVAFYGEYNQHTTSDVTLIIKRIQEHLEIISEDLYTYLQEAKTEEW